MKKSNIGLTVAALIILAAAGGTYYYRASHKTTVHFETVAVDRGAIMAKVTATGTLSALVTVQVGSQVSGRVSEIRVDFNSPVKKGQVIAKIDPPLFQAALDQADANDVAARGNLTKLQARADDAKAQLVRSEELARRKVIAQQDLDTMRANAKAADGDVVAAQGQVAQAKASLHQARVNLAYTTINSPITGVVISRSVDVGQTVAASLAAPTLFVIAQDLTKMQVDTSVAEADIGKLRSGLQATFTVDAYPSRKFKGVIRQIRNAPQTLQNVVTYDAVVDVDNNGLELRPGMTATVTFIYDQKDDVLRVANAALRFQPPAEMQQRGRSGGGGGPADAGGGSTSAGGAGARNGERSRGGGGGPSRVGGARRQRSGGDGEPSDRRTLWVLRDNNAIPLSVHTGLSDGVTTEVDSPQLQAGDRAITDATGFDSAKSGGAAPFRHLF
ncbi:MAG TPA: efflux RND transporter periplasmic adaptor subunit [Polyangia bacterium]|jgi:HlyD family secretion protein|nr:efflux RND transporter periplasmic adaptor subunit [Polyangia bacterium]